MEVSEYFTINLRIGDYLLPPITIKRSEELVYRMAERQINERLGFYASRYPNQEKSTYLCMAALDIAVSFQREKSDKDQTPVIESMTRMLNELNEVLSQPQSKD